MHPPGIEPGISPLRVERLTAWPRMLVYSDPLSEILCE